MTGISSLSIAILTRTEADHEADRTVSKSSLLLNGSAMCNAAYSSLPPELRSALGDIHFLYNNEASIQLALRLIRSAKSNNPDEPIVLMAYSWGGPAAFRVAQKLGNAGLNGKEQTYDVDLMLLIDPEFYGRSKSSLFQVEQVPENVSRAVEYKAQFPTHGFEYFPFPQNGESNIEGALRVELTAYADVEGLDETVKMTHQSIVNTQAGHSMMRRYLTSELHRLLGQ